MVRFHTNLMKNNLTNQDRMFFLLTLGTKGANLPFLTQETKGANFPLLTQETKLVAKGCCKFNPNNKRKQSTLVCKRDEYKLYIDISNYKNIFIEKDIFINTWNKKLLSFKDKDFIFEYSVYTHTNENLTFQRVNNIGLLKAFKSKSMDSMFTHLNLLNHIETLYKNKGYYPFYTDLKLNKTGSFIYDLLYKKISNDVKKNKMINNNNSDNYNENNIGNEKSFIDISKPLFIWVKGKSARKNQKQNLNHNNQDSSTKITLHRNSNSNGISNLKTINDSKRKYYTTQATNREYTDLSKYEEIFKYEEIDLLKLASLKKEKDISKMKKEIIEDVMKRAGEVIYRSDQPPKIEKITLLYNKQHYKDFLVFDVYSIKVNYSITVESLDGKRIDREEFNMFIKVQANPLEIEEKELIKSIESFLSSIKDINSRGFILEQSLEKYSFIRDLIPLFSIIPIEMIIKDKYPVIIMKIINIISTQYLLALNKTLRHTNSKENTKTTDLQADLINVYKRLKGLLDPFIRLNMQKRGITITQNTYVGFDTEYDAVDVNKNELISVQLAVNTKSIIKIPKNVRLNNKDFSKESDVIKDLPDFNNDVFKDLVERSVIMYRELKYKKHDLSITHLIRGLKRLGENEEYGVKRMSNDDYHEIFTFPRTPIRKGIYINKENGNKGWSLADIIKESKDLVKNDLEITYGQLLTALKKIYDNVTLDQEEIKIKINDEVNSKDYQTLPRSSSTSSSEPINKIKELTRFKMRSFTEDFINVTKIKNIYLIAHLTNADLCMLNDFNELKEDLDIVNSSFVTRGKPLIIDKNRVFIRDTMLLAPAGNSSLAAIGKLYGSNKVDLGTRDKGKMSLLLENERDLFIDYGLQDAVIPLIHACYMEDFNYKLNKIGIPLTLSSLGTTYVKYKWLEMGYEGYQVNPDILIGDTNEFMTPRGMKDNLQLALSMPLYISAYKGGRNECYMYGTDNKTKWIDYDLTSAYTTGMSVIGDPLYKGIVNVTMDDLKEMKDEEIIYSFTVIKASFRFPGKTKYPSIPVFLDKTSTVYPKSGNCVITGIEYVLAKNQGCIFWNVSNIIRIPFGETQPFGDILKEIQAKRRKYPKGSINNLLYKEMGNSIYGNTVRGISNKKKFDIKTGTQLRMEPGLLSNPLIGSWTTAFIRSVVGECLHNIDVLSGKVVSCTTDGFVTDIKNLEEEIMKLETNCFMKMYQEIRKDLSNDPTSLEVKHSGNGIISWSTRGQFSLNAGIAATTGFQRKQYEPPFLDNLLKNQLSKADKSLEYVQQRLRSALDLYRKGGHVTKLFSDRLFRLHFDNRRIIDIPKGLEDNIDFSNIIFDSNPASKIDTIRHLRSMSKINIKPVYDKRIGNLAISGKYRDYTDLAIRNFLKAVLSNKIALGDVCFKDYESLIKFIKGYKKGFRISKSSLSNLKNRPMIYKSIPLTQEVKDFYQYVKKHFPSFNIDELDTIKT